MSECPYVLLELAVVHEVGVVLRVWEVWEAHHLLGRVGEHSWVNAGPAFFCVVLGGIARLEKESKNGVPLSRYSTLG